MGKVAIIGLGTAGPAAALNIVRRLPGWTVEIFDKAAKPSAVGAGIGFQPIGMTALKKLGLWDTIKQHGARIDGIHSTSNGRTVLDVAYSRYHSKLYGLGLHRGVLFESLLSACELEPYISLHFGVGVNDVKQTSNHVTLSTDVAEAPLGPFDLVILADGAHSHLRDKSGIPSWTRRYDYGALFSLIPDELNTFGNTLVQAHAGPGCHETLGFLPTGLPWGARSKADFTTTLYFNLRGDEWGAALGSGGYLGGESTEYLGQEPSTTQTNGPVNSWDPSRLQAWKDKCCRLMPQAADLVQKGISDSRQVAFARYSDSVVWRFHSGRVALLGDCAHAMSPQLGQGCNLALIDAEKLVDELVKNANKLTEITHDDCGATTSGTPLQAKIAAPPAIVPEALAAYTAARWKHIQFYAMQSRVLTPMFASRSKLLRSVRDAAMAKMCRAPGISTYVHQVLCGAQAPGVFGTIPESEWLGFLDD